MKNRNDKYRLAIVSMDDKGTNTFTAFSRKFLKSRKAVAALYTVAGLLTLLAFVFQIQGVGGDIISTVLSYACIFGAGFLWLDLIVYNFHVGNKIQAVIIILGIVACFLIMEQICTGYPSSGLEFPRVTVRDSGIPFIRN